MSQHTSPTLTTERRAAIAKIVTQSGAARAADMAARFDVNPATIRRDLQTLEEQGKIQRVHGGAVAVEKAAPESAPAPPSDQEARIGQVVAEMIADGETVFLGPGRLPLAVARCLAGRSRLTIITNGLEIAHWVAANTPHTLIVTGGQAEGRDLGLVGQLAKATLSNLRAAYVILELDGISAVGGLTDDDLPQAEIVRSSLEIGSQVIVTAQAERVGQAAAVYIAPISDADVIVTAREAPSPFLWDLSESGVRVILA
jgi:DeoR family transcriptional regulator, aga operon transcriptional repressor